MLEEGVSDHCHEHMTVKALPGSSFAVVEVEFLFQLLMGLLPSWIKGSRNTGGGVCSGGSGCETRNFWLGTARGRIGFAVDRWLPYITGGLGFGGIKMTANNGTSEATTNLGWPPSVAVRFSRACIAGCAGMPPM